MVASSLWSTAGAVGSALRRTVQEAGRHDVDPFVARSGYHRVLRHYYANSAFEDFALWDAYKARHRLPRGLRGAYNPTRRAVDFAPGHVYPGAWSEDGRPLPDGTPHAIQFPPDVLADRPDLVLAGLQSLDWGNWRSARHVYVREGAMLGSVFVEVVDDLDRLKVYPEVVPLERVVELTLDATGNVKGYALEYRTSEGDSRPYLYRKEVTPESIATYKDGQRFAYDDSGEPVQPNPYGFAPAAWVKHRDVGGLFGAPAIDGVVPKIEELNALATGLHDFVNKFSRQPLYFKSDEEVAVTDLSGGSSTPTSERTAAENAPDRVLYLQGPRDSDVSWLMQPMPLDGVADAMAKLIEEIESDLPEIVLDEQLRGMSQVTGPGAERLVSDVRAKVEEMQANYDAGTVKLLQMGAAIGGWRANTGAWGPRGALTRQQAKFLGFDLDSFAAGDLDLALLPRPLVARTEDERLAALEARKRAAGLSNAYVRRALGVVSGTEAQMAAQNAAIDDELRRELELSGDLLAAP